MLKKNTVDAMYHSWKSVNGYKISCHAVFDVFTGRTLHVNLAIPQLWNAS